MTNSTRQLDSALTTLGFHPTEVCNKNDNSWRIVRSVLVASLSPIQVVRVQRPSAKYTEVNNINLHSTFRHDMKIRTSDEGRVMKTAAAFTKGLLELEGDLPPILVSLVHKEKDSQHMLDHTGHTAVEKDLKKCKERINTMMQKDINFEEMTKKVRESLVGPERLVSLHRALKKIGVSLPQLLPVLSPRINHIFVLTISIFNCYS